MADNSILPVAVGTETFANDDIGGIKHPRIKVMWGDHGIANYTSAASPLPVTFSGTTTVTGTVAATQSGVWTVGVTGTVAVTGTVGVSGTVTVAGAVNATIVAAIPTGANVIGAVTQSGNWPVRLQD